MCWHTRIHMKVVEKLSHASYTTYFTSLCLKDLIVEIWCILVMGIEEPMILSYLPFDEFIDHLIVYKQERRKCFTYGNLNRIIKACARLS